MQPIKKKSKLHEKFLRFVYSEFVKTHDELVTNYVFKFDNAVRKAARNLI